MDSAYDIFTSVVPLLRSNITAQTDLNVKAEDNMLEYTSVLGTIFNDFLMDCNITITRSNVEDWERKMNNVLGFYERWHDEVFGKVGNKDGRRNKTKRPKGFEKQFISLITYGNLRLSITGFLRYCKNVFELDSSISYVYVTHSNSTTIEAVFSQVQGSKRDTALGFQKAMAALNSKDSQRFLEIQGKKAVYDARDIPEQSTSTSKNLLGRKDKQRDEIITTWQKQCNAGSGFWKVNLVFSQIGGTSRVTSLSTVSSFLFAKLKDRLQQTILPRLDQGYHHFLLMDKEFSETMKVSIFTPHESWCRSLSTLSRNDQGSFNASCGKILDILLQCLQHSQRKSRGRDSHPNSYHFQIFELVSERTGVFGADWNMITYLLPSCLKDDDNMIALLVLHLLDCFLQWVREAIDGLRCSRRAQVNGAGQTGVADDDELITNVNNFVGWSVFDTIKNLERNFDRIVETNPRAKIDLLESMQVYEQDILLDEEYVQKYFTLSNRAHNKRGLTLISKEYFGFAKELMREVSKFQVKSFKSEGNDVVGDSIRRLRQHEKLKETFVGVSRELFNEKDIAEADILVVYDEICKKVFHAWAGEQTRKFKEKNTGRCATGTTNLAFRDDLNAIARKRKKWERRCVVRYFDDITLIRIHFRTDDGREVGCWQGCW